MRYFALHLKSLAKQFLTPFRVDELLFISFGRACKAVFDAISRGCATLHFTWKALQRSFWCHFTWMRYFSFIWQGFQSNFWRYFTWMRYFALHLKSLATWMRYFALHLKSLAKHFLTLFHVDAQLFIVFGRACKAAFDAISRGCVTLHSLKSLAKQFLTPFHVDALALAPEVDKMSSRRFDLGIFWRGLQKYTKWAPEGSICCIFRPWLRKSTKWAPEGSI